MSNTETENSGGSGTSKGTNDEQTNERSTGKQGAAKTSEPGAQSKPEVHVTAIKEGKPSADLDLVCKLLRATEDNLIGPKNDVDFTFPWDTVKHKDYEFVKSEHFLELLKKEYGSTCTYNVLTDYSVEVIEMKSENKHDVALKVNRNELSGNINGATIVSITCDKKKGKKRDKVEPVPVDLSVVKTEMDNSQSKQPEQKLFLLDKHPLTLKEWSVIQKLRSRGKNNKCFYR